MSSSGRGKKAERSDPDESNTGFQAVARATELLGMFSTDEPALSLAQMSARLEVSKPTAHRYATALRRAGFLNHADGVYTLGPRVVELAAAALAGLDVIEVAGPHLDRLGAATRQTSVLAVWDGEAPVAVRVHDAAAGQIVRVVVSVGSRLTTDGAHGRVFRAYLDPGDESPELIRARRDGVVYSASVVEGIRALAAPVFQGDQIVATMALVGTAAAIPGGTRSQMARSLREAAAALSLDLGHVADVGG
ncbi:MAG: helix-turn-helix domain-containing protein [Actinobacteria bacterium]|nr:helix-turn-helix domain-containing protein [Actinomycetota bacterium]